MHEEITESTEQISPDVLYQQDKAAIDIQISTAKTYPRNITRSLNNAIAIVTIDPDTAQTCTYTVPRGGKPVTGPSVHLAKILAQVWGNLRIEAKVVSIDARQITSEAVCFDLENNLAIKVQVKRSIMGKSGRYSDDMITVTGNAANAIALRNAVLSVIPRAIVDKVHGAAKALISGGDKTDKEFRAHRNNVITRLKESFGVTEEEILAAVGKLTIEQIDPDTVVTLIGIGTAIKDGDTTVEQAFRGSKQDVKDKKENMGKKKVEMP